MSGRTTWWAKDAAWHRRELQVELGDEFGPAGPHILDVLSCWAQEQKSTGEVRGGFRALAREAFTESDLTRQIVDRAASIGAIDDLVIDPDGRRFTCRVSGFKADQKRGRAAWRSAAHRDRQAQAEAETATDTPILPPAKAPQLPAPPATPPPVDGDPLVRLAHDITGVLQRGIDSIPGDVRCKAPTVPVILQALKQHPVSEATALQVATATRATVQSQGRAPNIAGLYTQNLSKASVGRLDDPPSVVPAEHRQVIKDTGARVLAINANASEAA